LRSATQAKGRFWRRRSTRRRFRGEDTRKISRKKKRNFNILGYGTDSPSGSSQQRQEERPLFEVPVERSMEATGKGNKRLQKKRRAKF